MKKNLSLLVVAMSLLCSPVFSQSAVDTTNKLGLAGDNLDLYAVLTLFQKSKTIEGFEKSLNDEQNKINNLDLNMDKKVDFIKVTTTQEKKDSAFRFVLQVDVTKTETQDVAVIYVSKEKGKISIQMVGDEELYGKDYVIEPKGNSSVTANPGYSGSDPVTVNVPATTVVIETAPPVVQYVYSPAYVPYVPPYYYGYYPGWFAFSAVVTWGMYAGFHSHYHGGYYGGHYGGNNNVIINTGNRNQINHYNNSRNTSNTVANNRKNGSYGDGRGANRGGTGVSNNMNNRGTGNRGSTGVSNNMNNKGAGNRGSSVSNNISNNRGSTSRPSTSNNMSSRSSNMSSGRTMGGGGGRSMGGGGGGRRR